MPERAKVAHHAGRKNTGTAFAALTSRPGAKIARLKDQHVQLKAVLLRQLEQVKRRKTARRPAADDAHSTAVLQTDTHLTNLTFSAGSVAQSLFHHSLATM